MKKEITLIIGDSWGCGEWVDPKDGLHTQHPGLAGYLINDGENVINLAVPGGSLDEIQRTLHSFLTANHYNTSIVKVYCIQTSVFRDFVENNNNNNTLNDLVLQTYDDFVFSVFRNFYMELNRLSFLYGKFPIYVIGGLMDSPDSNFFERNGFTHVHLACQSWVNLCVNNSPDVERLDTWDYVSPDLVIYLSKVKKISKKDITENLNFYNKREKICHNYPDLFYPDGIHPNRQAHKILFDFLKNNNF